MKVYRFEHKKTKTGMFTTRLHEKSECSELNESIRYRLLDHYTYYPKDLPDPKEEYLSMITGDYELNKKLALVLNNTELNHKYSKFCDSIYSGEFVFGCDSFEKLSKWILGSFDLLNKMLKCGYFLYEIEIDENSEIYDLESQVVFKKESIKSKNVLHAKKLLREYLS